MDEGVHAVVLTGAGDKVFCAGADLSGFAADASLIDKHFASDLFIELFWLMAELGKVRRVIANQIPEAPHETLLTVDATTGQNGLRQARLFSDTVAVSGLVLTKLDGTAKGGIVLGICDELKVPVRYIGLGERAEDLREFDPDEFVEALFGQGGDEAAAA